MSTTTTPNKFERYAKVIMNGEPAQRLIGVVQRKSPGYNGMWDIRWPGGLAIQSATGLTVISNTEAAKLWKQGWL